MINVMYGNVEDGFKNVATAGNEREAHAAIVNYISRNFKVKKAPYFRGWLDFDGNQMVDYGSHVNFFKICY